MPGGPPTNPLEIRPATALDAAELAEIRTASRRSAEGAPGLVEDEIDFLDRLSIPQGEDYFCVLARRGDRTIGYLIGGGSRDLDRKAHGEIYEVAVLPDERGAGVARALLTHAIAALEHAQFAGTLFSVPVGDEALVGLARSGGMTLEGPHPRNDALVRFERPLPLGTEPAARA